MGYIFWVSLLIELQYRGLAKAGDKGGSKIILKGGDKGGSSIIPTCQVLYGFVLKMKKLILMLILQTQMLLHLSSIKLNL